MAPFDQKFYLTMGLAVGGTSESWDMFSDMFSYNPAKPWLNNEGETAAATAFWNGNSYGRKFYKTPKCPVKYSIFDMN